MVRRQPRDATRTNESLGVAALGAAYQGHLDEARALSERLAAISKWPTLRAFQSYVTGEIDALAGRIASAEQQYERAISLARGSGATFVEGIAAVGLLTVRADAGRVDDALVGYRDVIE